jgi:glutathione synthase/RimK-type ligase-like ATP-grasp enzyme
VKTSKQIVVISDDEDAHIPYVQKHLARPMHILDPQTLLEGTNLTFELHGKRTVPVYGGVTLNNVSGVWYRKPRCILGPQLPVAEAYRSYSLSALHEHTDLLLTTFEGARWLSPYYDILKAESKVLQGDIARKLGMRMPATLITSDAGAAKTFIRAQGQVIVKPLSNAIPRVGNQYQMFFASRVTKQKLPDLSNLHLAPAIFQQTIDPAYDVRVTVVGTQAFAAAIFTNDKLDSPVRDWRARQYDESAQIEAYTLPRSIADQCVSHVKALRLSFGALDFVADKQGKLWFLENNPNGQWAFVEKATGQPIGKAIADFLSGK